MGDGVVEVVDAFMVVLEWTINSLSPMGVSAPHRSSQRRQVDHGGALSARSCPCCSIRPLLRPSFYDCNDRLGRRVDEHSSTAASAFHSSFSKQVRHSQHHTRPPRPGGPVRTTRRRLPRDCKQRSIITLEALRVLRHSEAARQAKVSQPTTKDTL